MKFDIKTKRIILEFREAPYLNIGFTWDFLHLDTGLPTKNETLMSTLNSSNMTT